MRLAGEPVPGAAGYVIERTDPGRPPVVLDHGGADVPAVPSDEFADTGLADGAIYGYRVGAVADAEDQVWAWSDPGHRDHRGRPAGGRADRRGGGGRGDGDRAAAPAVGMIGAERLSQLLLTGELEAALRRAHDDLGVAYVRAHAILHDDLGVVTRAADGTLRSDFDRVDAAYSSQTDRRHSHTDPGPSRSTTIEDQARLPAW